MPRCSDVSITDESSQFYANLRGGNVFSSPIGQFCCGESRPQNNLGTWGNRAFAFMVSWPWLPKYPLSPWIGMKICPNIQVLHTPYAYLIYECSVRAPRSSRCRLAAQAILLNKRLVTPEHIIIVVVKNPGSASGLWWKWQPSNSAVTTWNIHPFHPYSVDIFDLSSFCTALGSGEKPPNFRKLISCTSPLG